jgi:hypothetical protein
MQVKEQETILISADEALKLSKANKSELSERRTDESKLKTIYSSIKKAALKGKTKINYNAILTLPMIETLISDGYNVLITNHERHYSDEKFKPFISDELYIYPVISWGKK